ncbi:MAG: AraC family transcriptional regulator [Bacteroidota bacterium]
MKALKTYNISNFSLNNLDLENGYGYRSIEESVTETTKLFDIQRIRNQKIFPCKDSAPCRFNFYVLGLHLRGTLELGIDARMHRLTEPCLYFIPANSICTIKESENGIDDYIVKFKSEFLALFLKNFSFCDQLPFFQLNSDKILPLNRFEAYDFLDQFQIIRKEFLGNEPSNENIIKGLFYVLLLRSKILYSNKHPEFNKANQTVSFIDKFKDLINKHYLEKRQLPDYADLMNISPNHLNEKIKNETGKTPAEFIRERVILEAKSLLCQTDMNVSEIAYHLNFDEASYFSKFFKRYTGESPGEYRNSYLKIQK